MRSEEHPASSGRLRTLLLVEPVSFALLVAWYIWLLQTTHRASWWLFPIWLAASFLAHRDTPKTLGWRADNLWAASRQASLFFGPCIAALCVTGALLGGLHRYPAHLLDLRRLWGYWSFCLLQQVTLNSYVTNRLLAALQSSFAASLASGLVFAAMHWPNPVLVPLTFVAGAMTAWMFVSQRNILPLTCGQAILGALTWWAFPIAWHHGMRVGPGYYTFHVPHYNGM